MYCCIRLAGIGVDGEKKLEMQGTEHEISGKAIVTAQKGFDRLIENPKGAHADKQ